jgi:hypothetical protein
LTAKWFVLGNPASTHQLYNYIAANLSTSSALIKKPFFLTLKAYEQQQATASEATKIK